MEGRLGTACQSSNRVKRAPTHGSGLAWGVLKKINKPKMKSFAPKSKPRLNYSFNLSQECELLHSI